MAIGDIYIREVVSIDKDATLLEAAQLMRQHHIGDVVVADSRNGYHVPVGMVTDRDIVIEVVARNLNVNDLSVGDVMSKDIVTAREGDGISETIALMRSSGVRRLPVVSDAGALLGIVSIDDLWQLVAEEATELSRVASRAQATEQMARP
ncbi:MAG: CBS domain-containing protein [Gammaproteobacteria bacterium]|nr:CBS domain-containing protein [Gammaproteobacteria bacterium]